MSKLQSTTRGRAKQLRSCHRQQEKIVLNIQERLQEKRRKEADIIQRVVTDGGPCLHSADINRLVSRLTWEKDKGSDWEGLAGRSQISEDSPEEGQRSAVSRLSWYPHDAANIPCDPWAQPNEDEEDADVSQPKHLRLDSHGEDQDCTDTVPFVFTVQGEWVSVYFDDQFYVGQVIDVHNPSEATVQYLKQTKGRKDYFWYPKVWMLPGQWLSLSSVGSLTWPQSAMTSEYGGCQTLMTFLKPIVDLRNLLSDVLQPLWPGL